MSEMTLQSTIQHSDGLFWQDVVEDVVILNVEQGIYFGTQDAAADIWRMIAQPMRVQDIVTELLANYEVERDACEADVLSFLTQLYDANLIAIIHEADA